MNWPLLLMAYSALFVFGLTDNARGPIYPLLLEKFSLSPSVGAWFFALSSLVGLLSNITAPKWIRYKDTTFWLRIGLIFLILSPITLALSGKYDIVSLMWISSITQGFGMGIAGMCMNLIVSRSSTPENRRKAFGGLHALYGISSLLAPQFFSLWLNLGSHWTSFFFLMGLPALIVILAFRKIEGKPIEQRSDPKNKPSHKMSLLWALMMGFYVSSEIVLSSRLPFFLQQSKGMDIKTSGFYLSGFFFCLMLGRLTLGLFHLPIKGRVLMGLSLIGTTVCLILGHSGFFWAFSLSGLSMSVFFPSAMDLLGEEYPDHLEYITSVVMSGIGFFLFAMHLGFGQLAAALGVELAMGLALVLTLFSFIFLLILPRSSSIPQ